jgi:hypothetical protein
LKHVLPFRRTDEDHHVLDKTSKFPVWFFGLVFAVAISVIVINQFLYDVRPNNSQRECTNACTDNGTPNACQHFCDCIYNEGNPLNACLDGYEQAKRAGADPGRGGR